MKNLFLLFAFLILISPDVAPAASLPAEINCKNCNLIVISLTSARKRNMSAYKYHRNTTPNIENFFSNAYYFTNAFAPASLTFTDALSLFYSVTPNVHQAFLRKRKRYTAKRLSKFSSLTEILNINGYKTAAFVSDEDYDYDWGIGKTFQYYFDRSYYAENGIDFHPFTYSVGTSQLVPIANRWLDNNHKSKFFLFLQAYDVHCPYTPKGKFEKLYDSPHSATIPFTKECFMTRYGPEFVKQNGKTKQVLKSYFSFIKQKEVRYYFDKKDIYYLISRYDAELTQADANLGPLFEKIKSLHLDKNTIVVFLSEHGDYLGENGYFMKPSPYALGNLHNANLNFPLIVKLPEQNKKFVQNQIIQTIDVAPSILDLLGLSPGKSMRGRSFKSVMNTQKEINDFAYGYSERYDLLENSEKLLGVYRLETIQNAEWKLNSSLHYKEPILLIEKPQYYLYNLKKDPEEKNNLANHKPGTLKKLIKVMEEKKKFYLAH